MWMPEKEHIVWVSNRGGHIHSSELLYTDKPNIILSENP